MNPIAIHAGATALADAAGYPIAPPVDQTDQRGIPIRIPDPASSEATVLVFFRGHWCPYCRRYLSKLQQHLPRIQQRNARVVAISPEPMATIARLAQELQLTYALLSDTAGQSIAAYGVRNGFAGARTLLPHASVFVISPDGLIRYRSIDRNYKKRTTIRTILGVLDQGF